MLFLFLFFYFLSFFLQDGFSFCKYPFVFEVKEKAVMMEYDAELQMKVSYLFCFETSLAL